MSYAILRIQKHSAGGAIAAIGKHNSRENRVDNADPARRHLNEQLVGSNDVAQDVQRRLDEAGVQPRNSTTVRAVEHIMTASPEWWKQATPAQQQQFFDSSRKWLEGRYGAVNVVNLTIHRDETSPHLHAVIVPIVGDKLNAKELFGGAAKMREMQTSFAAALQQAGTGLKRGIEGSRAKHQTLGRFYGQVEQIEAAVASLPADKLDQVRDHLTKQAIAQEQQRLQLQREGRTSQSLSAERDRLKKAQQELLVRVEKTLAHPEVAKVDGKKVLQAMAQELRKFPGVGKVMSQVQKATGGGDSDDGIKGPSL